MRTPTSRWRIPTLIATVDDRVELFYVTCGTADGLISQAGSFGISSAPQVFELTFVEHPAPGMVAVVEPQFR